MCWVGVSNKLERVLSGPAPGACQEFASQDRFKGDQWVKAQGDSSACARLQSVTSVTSQKDVDDGAKEKLKQAELQVGTF